MMLQDWEDKYLHPGFWNATLKESEVSQPCPDVFMFPLFSEHAADAFIEVMEGYGKWSNGKNEVKLCHLITCDVALIMNFHRIAALLEATRTCRLWTSI